MNRSLLLFAAALCAPAALASPIAFDAAAINGFTGSVTLDASAGSTQLVVALDYAVYAPGDYPGADPSQGAEYVYAYQAFNSGSSNLVLATASVGLLDGAIANNLGDDASYGIVGGEAPLFTTLTPNSALYDWIGISPGALSTVFLFTSPQPPTFGPGSIQTGGLSAQDVIPTPLPEPASLVLLGAVLALRRR